MTNLSQDDWCPVHDSNLAHTKYETEALPLVRTYLVASSFIQRLNS
jgi:hypothetical protein